MHTKNNITLKEYLNQQEPIRNQNVIVDKRSFKVTSTIKMANGEVRSRVYFKTKDEILSGIEYCLIGKRFYTTDADGNPKNQSCFRIK